MQPKNRTCHIPQPTPYSISIPKINSRHSDAPPPFISPIDVFDLFHPILPHFLLTTFPPTIVDQVVAVSVIRDEVWIGGIGSPGVDSGG